MAEPRTKRSRSDSGKFKGNNPEHPELNEAWEPAEFETTEKEVKYSIRQEVIGTTGSNAGKYATEPAIRPRKSGVHTTYH